MTIIEKIKTTDKRNEQNKAQYYLNRQTSKISVLSSKNIEIYKFSTGNGVSPEKDLLEKAATIKRLLYLPLGKDLKAQTGVANNHYKFF